MMRLLNAEALKLRTTWALAGFVLATIGIVTLGVVGQLANRDEFGASAKEELLSAIEPTGFLVPTFALLLGILAFTVEFRHGTITQTFLVAPVRERVLLAKTIVYALLGLALAALAIGLVLAIALPWLSGDGESVSTGDRDVRTMIAGVVGASVLWGVLGVALGALIRNQVLAIVGALVWLLIVENVVGAVFDDAWRYLPGPASRAMSERPFADDAFDEQLSRTAATLATTAYAVGATVLAAVFLRRRDVS